MSNETTMVHVTHEATGKIGGIGAVLHGFFTSQTYLDSIKRSILVGPLFTHDVPVNQRLGEGGEIFYSSIDGIVNTKFAPALQMIEKFFSTAIVYGRKTFTNSETGIQSSPEILLIDVRYMNNGPINHFKKQIFEKFDIHCDMYEHIWECEQYVRLAPAAIAALKEIAAAHEKTTVVAHEFMGMATAMAAMLEPCCDFKTAFYAHEVATMRRIVEDNPGHDTMFYNALKRAHRERLYVDEVFGNQDDYFKHAFVKAARYCDSICAVGDYVLKELKFMAPEFENSNINVVYNGIPAHQISLAEKLNSKAKLQQYCENMLGYRPDYIFTHVTRLVPSKGLWRDMEILDTIEKQFQAEGKTGVFFLLSTETAKRKIQDIINMETAYNWPVAHRELDPDLTGGEAKFYTKIQEFNAKSKNIKTVFINQFGFDRKSCGTKMPENMEFMDIRKGGDVEFGLSIYEPFGIAQLESLTFGGICVVTNVCGCAGFVRNVSNGDATKNVIVADYTELEKYNLSDIKNPLDIGQSVRQHIENSVSEEIALRICSQLPADDADMEKMLQTGYDLAKHMSWDVVVKDYLLKSLEKSLQVQNI